MRHLLLVLQVVAFYGPRALCGQAVSVAVLPFRQASADVKLGHWEYTIPLLLKLELGSINKIRLAPDDSIEFGGNCATLFAYREVGSESKSPADLARLIGRTLEVAKVVQGEYRQDQGLCRLRVTIMDVSTGNVSGSLVASGPDWHDAIKQIVKEILSQLNVPPSFKRTGSTECELRCSADAMDFLGQALKDKNSGTPLGGAETGLRKAIAADPACPIIQQALAYVLCTEGKLDEAATLAHRAAKACPESSGSHYVLGLVYLTQGLNTLARAQFLEAKGLDPRNPIILLKLGQTYAAQGQLEEAIPIFQRAEKLAFYMPLIHEELGRTYANQGERTQAIAELRLAERYDTDTDATILVALAQTYDGLRDTPKAVDFYEKFLAAAAKLGLHTPLVDEALDTLRDLKQRMQPHFVKASPPKALTATEFKAETDARLDTDERRCVNDPFECTPEMAQWAKTSASGAKTDTGEAFRLFSAIIRHRPVITLPCQRNAEEAFRAMLDPAATLTCEDYTFLFVSLARSVGLRAFFVQVEKDHLGRFTAHACAGVFLEQGALLVDPAENWFGAPQQGFKFLGDLQATGLYLAQSTNLSRQRVAAKLAPDIAAVHFCLALGLARLGELPEAKIALKRGLELDSTSWFADFFRGSVALLGGNLDGAVYYLERSRSAQPEFPMIHHFLAQAYDSQGMLSKAKAEYRAYLDEFDDQHLADQDRERLLALDNLLDN